MATPAATAVASRLISINDLDDTWHPLTGHAAPEHIPDTWTGPHVGQRLVEGLRILARLPMRRGPRVFGNHWPMHSYEWEDLLAQEEAEAAQKEQDRREQNRVRVLPNAREISHMEQAIAWPGAYLRELPQLLRVCGGVAFWRSRHKDIEAIARHKLKLPFHLVRKWNREGLDRIASGLRRDRVMVF